MLIQDFAERILFGPNLADKLVQASTLIDPEDRPRSARALLPEWPARAPELKPRPRLRQPPRNLSDERSRGELLHLFANHELLALELMALVLLRFPEAPRRFRLGLAAVMQDEQRHLLLYLNRMREFGVKLGDYELNDFFWRMLRDVGSPLDFSVRMALTFEQANLDFAYFYRTAFESVEDDATASILGEVLRDEIVHVRRGFAFFDEHRPRRSSAWSEYLALLPPGLDATRARGKVFAVEPRLAAGLPADFVEELGKHRRSKGRPPAVFLFDPFIESDLRPAGPARRSFGQLRMAVDFATAVVVLARHEDVVLCNRRPSSRYLDELALVDFPVPEFARLRNLVREGRKLGSVKPWGWSPRLARRLQPLVDGIVGKHGDDLREALGRSAPLWSWAFRKDTARAWERELNAAEPGAEHGAEHGDFSVSNNRSEAEQAVSSIHFKGGVALIRPVLGAAGMGQRQIPPGGPLGHLTYPVIVERRQTRLADFSAHIDIEAEDVRTVGWTRQLVTDEGRYVGSIVGRLFDPDDLRIFSAGGMGPALEELRSVRSRLFNAALYVGERLRERGFRGPVGIDAFIYMSPEGKLALRTTVDVNVRYTMGRVALEAARRMQSGRSGLLLHVTRRSMRSHGASRAPFSALTESAPAQVVRTPARLLARGVLPVTDIYRARRHGLIFCVGTSPRDALAQIRDALHPEASVLALF